MPKIILPAKIVIFFCKQLLINLLIYSLIYYLYNINNIIINIMIVPHIEQINFTFIL